MASNRPGFETYGPWVALSVVLVVAALALLGMPQWAAALVGLAAMAVLTWFDAFAGLCLLLFSFAFFLGESYHPWYFLLPLIALTWLAVATVFLYRRQARPDWNLLWPVVLLPLSALVSLPLMSRELYWAIICQPLRITGEQLLLPSHTYPTFGLAFFADLVLYSLLLPVAVACLDWASAKQKKQAVAAFAAFVVLNCLAAFVLFAFPIDGSYLGVSLVGHLRAGIAGLAYNRAYFASWLVWCLPFTALAFWSRRIGLRARMLMVLAAALLLVCLGLNGQKANILALAAFLGAMVIVMPRKKVWLKAAILFVPLVLVILMDLTLLDGFLWHKITTFDPLKNVYSKTWQFAWALWQQDWLLGVGTGSYAWWDAWALDYVTPENWHALGNAHSQWMQLLAEQGLAGLLSFLFIMGQGFRWCWKSLRERNSANASIAFMGLAVVTVCCFWHTFLHIRSFALWWILYLALACSCVSPEKRLKIPLRGTVAAGLVVVALLGWRCYQIYAMEPKAGFMAGFHLEEKFEGGREGRWIEARAVWVIPTELHKEYLALDVATFLPGVEKNPQELTIWATGGEERVTTLYDNTWRGVRLPLPVGTGPIAIHFAAKYQLNPAKQGWSKDNRNLSAVVVAETGL